MTVTCTILVIPRIPSHHYYSNHLYRHMPSFCYIVPKDAEVSLSTLLFNIPYSVTSNSRHQRSQKFFRCCDHYHWLWMYNYLYYTGKETGKVIGFRFFERTPGINHPLFSITTQKTWFLNIHASETSVILVLCNGCCIYAYAGTLSPFSVEPPHSCILRLKKYKD